MFLFVERSFVFGREGRIYFGVFGVVFFFYFVSVERVVIKAGVFKEVDLFFLVRRYVGVIVFI